MPSSQHNAPRPTIAERIKKLSTPQRELLLTYGSRDEYSGNRRMAEALVRQDLAAWGPDTSKYGWTIGWTDVDVK